MIEQLLLWLEEQKHKAPSHNERVAYTATIKYIKENLCTPTS